MSRSRVIDIVFSLDSVFTAVGLAKDLPVMVAAIVVAILVMMWVSRSIGAFIDAPSRPSRCWRSRS